MDLTWDPPLTDNGSALTGYVVRYRSDGGANWMSETLAVTTRHTVRNLTNGTEYTFEVRAVNGAGEGAAASVTETPRRPNTPGRVEWSTNQPQVGQELTPTLIDPDAPALAEARWRWRRQRWPRSDAGDSLSAPAPEARSGESKLGVIARTRQYRPQVSDLHQWLWVEVTYTDDYTDDSDRHRVSATTLLSWRAPVSDGGLSLTGYEYRRRAGSGSWSGWTGVGTNTTRTVTGLSNGTIHHFEVRARNAAGAGAAARASATPVQPNRPPVIEGPANPSVPENSTTVASYTVSDPDGDATRWLELGGTQAGSFDFSGGALRFDGAPDYESDPRSYEVTVRATDGERPTDSPVTVTVTNVDEAGTVSLTTTRPQVGHSLIAVLTDPDEGVTGASWRWLKLLPGPGSREPESSTGSLRAPGSTSLPYTPTSQDAGLVLRARVDYDDAHGPDKVAASGETEPVAPRPLTVAFGSSSVPGHRRGRDGDAVAGRRPLRAHPDHVRSLLGRLLGQRPAQRLLARLHQRELYR